MVGIILCFSVVANIKMACAGGSSKVFKKALKADAIQSEPIEVFNGYDIYACFNSRNC